MMSFYQIKALYLHFQKTSKHKSLPNDDSDLGASND